MSGGFPFGLDVCNAQDVGTSVSTGLGVQLTTGTAGAKGSWTQLVASTTYDCIWASVMVSASGSVDATACVDIAVGGSGSEKAIIQNLVCMGQESDGATNGLTLPARYSFPLHIPSGTRISARAQSPTGSQTLNVSMTLFDGSITQMEGPSIIDTYGFQSSNTYGATIDPGATANTKGSYTQLTSSTTYDLLGFIVGFDVQNQTSGSVSGSLWTLTDIAIGGAGSENVIVPNISVFQQRNNSGSTYNMISPLNTEFIPINIPSGTRIAARGSSNSNTATSRLWGVTLYGVRA